MAYGLTAEGFVGKDLQTIKAELEAEFISTFGSDLDVSAESVAGQLIGNLSKKFASIWEALEALYSAFNPESAEDIALDRSAALTSVLRLEATKTEVIEALVGDTGTLVDVGHTMAQTGSGVVFESVAPVTLGLGSPALSFSFTVLTITVGATYSFGIDGTAIEYVAVGGDDAEDVINGLIAALATAALDITGVLVPATDTCEVQVDDGISGFTLAFADAKLQLETLGNYSRYLCQTTGVNPAPAGTVDVIGTPVVGLDSASNLAAGVTGRAIESDVAFRIRRRISLQKGYATEVAIAYHVLTDVDNVTYAICISNRLDTVDADGRPPHSMEVIVIGGDEQEICEKIWEVSPPGIEFVGDISHTVVDSAGRTQTVKFNRPVPRYIWIKITLTPYSEEIFPVDGAALIKQAIVDYAASAMDVNKDVIRQRLYTPIYSIPGVGAVSVLSLAVTAAPTPAPGPGDYHETDVVVAANQVAVFDVTRIDVTVL
jgi:uncharacterized phage protein gp47/JayE